MEKFGLECKKLMTQEIKQKIEDASALFVTSFNRLAVSEQEQLRTSLQQNEASFLLVKNRIAKAALKQLNQESVTSLIQGPTALTLGRGDYISVSKTLVDFAKKHESFKILGGYVDQQLLDFNTIKRLAAIPSTETLLAQIVYGLKSPIQGLVNTLSATVKKFVLVIDKIREQKEEK